MFTKQTDGKFEKWVESGLSTFEIRRLVAEIYFSVYHVSHTDGPDIKGGNNTELEGICRSVVE